VKPLCSRTPFSLNAPNTRLSMSRIVFTGGPGVGKTTVLLELRARGCTIVGDSARTIIQDRRSRGLSPRPNAYEFAQEVLRLDVENYACHAAASDVVFFDRSVLDSLCMLDQVEPLSKSELSAWLSKYQYSSKVFVFPPWEAIYVNDAERDHTFEHVEAVHRGVREWYSQCRYQILEVPKVSVSERCAFVVQALESE
jgi:predicted ATPase